MTSLTQHIGEKKSQIKHIWLKSVSLCNRNAAINAFFVYY